MRAENGLGGGVVGGALQAGGSVHGGVTFHTTTTTSVELLLKAVDHISSRHPVMRAVAMFELEQLAVEHAGVRHTVCNILAAYLDLPHERTVAEQRVRAAAYAVLCRVGREVGPPGRS